MNIIDAYIKYNNQLIFILSGFSGTKKSHIAELLSHDTKLKLLSLKNYYIKEKGEKIKLPNDKEVTSYDNIDVIDWDKLVDDIKKYKNKGIILEGEFFPSNKLENLQIDHHLHIKLSKQNLLKKRIEFNKNKDKNFDEQTEILLMNQITYPFYLDIIQKSHINKFINGNEIIEQYKEDEYVDKMYDLVFDIFIKFIVEKLELMNLGKYIE